MAADPVPGIPPVPPEVRAREYLAIHPAAASPGLELAAAGPGSAEVRLPLLPQSGSLDEGTISTLATAAGHAAAWTQLPAESAALTVEFKVNIIALGPGESLLAKAQVVRTGKTITVCRADVSIVNGGVESPCAICLMTLAAVPR